MRILIILFLFAQSLCAQLNNRALEDSLVIDSSRVRRLSFVFSTLHFVKNNEYFGDIADGYTRWGYQLNPRVVYQPAANVQLSGGVFLKYDFGTNFGTTGFTQIQPTFTLNIRHRDWLYSLGTIAGSVNHRLVEPLYNFERLLQNRVENGLQIKTTRQKYFFDFWISYPQATGPGQTQQEMFWGGLSSNRQIYENKNLKINWICQFTGFHHGGQNLAVSLPIRSAFHLNNGLDFKWKTAGRFLKSIDFVPYLLIFSEIADQNTNGWAFYPTLNIQYAALNVQLNYWSGHNYVADYGGDLYQSVSRKFGNSSYQEPTRNLLIMRFIKDIKVINGLTVSLRFEPYYDILNQKLEHSEGIYANYFLAHLF